MSYIFTAVVLVLFSIGIILFFTHAHRLTFIILSRPVTLILMLFLWLSLPDYNKVWIDSYENHDGYHDVYETNFTGKPSKLERLFEDYTVPIYFIFNSLTFIFIVYLFFITRKVFKQVIVFDVEIDVIGMLSFAGLFLFNPIDPIIKYMPAHWMLSIKTFYLIAMGIWIFYYGEAKRLFKIQNEIKSQRHL